jgi:peroxiredoxin Q/BCP
LKDFCDSIGIPYELGSDNSGEVCRLYDVRRRFGLGTSRVTYILDADGIVRGAFHNEFRMRRHVQDALKTLKSISAPPHAAD